MLVVDDDESIREIVRIVVEREGFEVVEAADGAGARAHVDAGQVDLAVLDLHLPDVSGLDLLAQLRERDPDVQVIILTGAGSETDRVLGLVSGADDYVVKPFSVRELGARILACSRRRSAKAPRVIELGDLRIDLAARSVTVGGSPVELPRRELDLLVHLACHPGQTFTREDLLHAVWGSSAKWQKATTVTEHVRRLRNKIERDPMHPRHVITVRGTGYRFEPEPESAPVDSMPAVSRAEASKDATVVIVGTTVRFANPAALVLLGATSDDELVDHDVFEFVAPQSVGATKARHDEAASGRLPRPDLVTLRRVDGVEVLVELASTPVTWEDRPASQVTMWDLAGDTARLRLLATGIRGDVTEAVIIATTDQRIQSFNGAAEELYGWTEAEVLGRRLPEVVPWTSPALHEHARQRLFESGRWLGEVCQSTRGGDTVKVRTSKTLLRDGIGSPVGIISVNRQVAHDLRPILLDADDALDVEIRRALDNDEFTVHYQSVVSLDTGRRSGVEALVRWQHPSRGLLSPQDFMPAAERSGAIVELGDVVLRSACRQLQQWRASGHDLDLAVNLSARQLGDEHLPDRLAEVMAATGVPLGKLWLEVTETDLVQDLDQAKAVLQRIEDLGACVSIDDFGTGWASLTYLREFSVHALKIDRLFVHGLGTSSRDATIVSSMISLGRELGVATIAEGVETEAQRAHLIELGCEIAQGYLFGRPEPADSLDLGVTIDA